MPNTGDIVTKQSPCHHGSFCILVGIKLHLWVRLAASLQKQAVCFHFVRRWVQPS